MHDSIPVIHINVVKGARSLQCSLLPLFSSFSSVAGFNEYLMALQAEEQAAMDDSKVSTPVHVHTQYGLKCMHMHVTCPYISITENVCT